MGCCTQCTDHSDVSFFKVKVFRGILNIKFPLGIDAEEAGWVGGWQGRWLRSQDSQDCWWWVAGIPTNDLEEVKGHGMKTNTACSWAGLDSCRAEMLWCKMFYWELSYKMISWLSWWYYRMSSCVREITWMCEHWNYVTSLLVQTPSQTLRENFWALMGKG